MPRLTKRLIAATPTGSHDIILRDEGTGAVPGFHVRIRPGGSRTYLLYYRNAAGKERRYKIGRVEEMVPERAREIAQGLAEAVRRGQDPAEERKRARAHQDAPAETFAQAVEDYITREQIGRKGNATALEVKRTLLREGWGEAPLREITPADVRKLVEDMRDGGKKVRARPYLANRTFAYLRTFFAWCAEPGIDKVEISPMLGLKRPWEGEEGRDRVFSNDELRALWRAADALPGRTGQAAGAYLRIMLLTGKRRGILAAMRWDEIEDGLWTPARRRRRNKRAHATPLPRLALDIIENLPRRDGNPYVFAGRLKAGHIDPGSQLVDAIRAASGIEDFFFHACRHTVETRLAELRVPPHVRDLVLDHAPARGSGAGYDHHHYRDEMREALESWAAHIAGLLHGVIELPSRQQEVQALAGDLGG
jgi:integrase